jgi:hypothetical protein
MAGRIVEWMAAAAMAMALAAAEPYPPSGGSANALVTSNAPAWGKVAELIPIDL